MNAYKSVTKERRPSATGTRTEGNVKRDAVARLAMDNGLNVTAQAFCLEYLKDHNGTRAYMRVRPGCSMTTAASNASRLLGNVKVQAELARLARIAADAAALTSANTLRDAWAVLTADLREVCEVHVSCCRHCWGARFRYQYTDGELEDARADFRLAYARASRDDQVRLGEFDPKGGGGFDKRRVPNPECPTCAGVGCAEAVFHDSRTFSPQAAAAFLGVEVTKEGFKVRLRSKDHASDQLFRHFSLYRDKPEFNTPLVRIKDMTGRRRQPSPR